MRASTWVWIVVIVLVLVGGWYWVSQSGYFGAQPSTSAGVNGSNGQTNTGQDQVAAVVAVAHDATLGDYLVATNGMTLYHYTKDAAGVSNCTGTCAVNWPPYVQAAAEPLVAGNGVNGALATLTRANGSAQITYKGVPLYFWKNDVKPGDTTGHGVGSVWFVVKP